MNPNLRVLILAEHASAKFGGEAILPIQYFKLLRNRGIETWLIVHDRTRNELKSFFSEDFDRIHFVPDTFWHRFISKQSRILPSRLSNWTLGFILRLMTQIIQRRIAERLVKEQQIDIVHQPIPVSPREPSMFFGLGVPVVIGPMNGGIEYPPAFRRMDSRFVELSVGIARFLSNWLNILIPGKRQAAILLVANQRTKEVLPKGFRGKVVELLENGVDLSIWKPKPQIQKPTFKNDGVEEAKTQPSGQELKQPTRFVFVGRLVDWKAVDLLLIAFKRVVDQVSAELEIIGDGVERAALEAQARELGLSKPQNQTPKSTIQDLDGNSQEREAVGFTGWLSQSDCAQQLELADVLVLPSLLECGGAVVLEAMAVGIPVIATNWGGPADYLDESCGILVEPASRDSFIDDLAAAMLKLAAHPELRQAMGKAARQKVLDHFDWEVKVDKMLEIYQEAIEGAKTHYV